MQSDDDRSTHVDPDGAPIHGVWFLDLDVFHKGFARARGDDGWMHIDTTGRLLYRARFAAVEPFYSSTATRLAPGTGTQGCNVDHGRAEISGEVPISASTLAAILVAATLTEYCSR